jgi:phosphatidylglycerophosphatase A
METLSKIYLSWFGVGFIRKAPGTWGSLAALPLCFWMASFSVTIKIIFITVLTLIAIVLAQHYQTRHQLHDPQWIVIDEVLGMLICTIFLPQQLNYFWLIAFILFRIFDIIKIWPASWFDRLHHGAGTILDDVISAFYALSLLLVIEKFLA